MHLRYRLFGFLAILVLVAASAGPVASAQIHLPAFETPKPSIGPIPLVADASSPQQYDRKDPEFPGPSLGPPLLVPAVDGFNFDDNGALTGFVFIPPDPYLAVGPDHAVNVGNVAIEWRTKANPAVRENLQSLQSFFSTIPGPPAGPGTSLGTFTFDPKVIFDQYNGRFVVLALERTDVTSGDPSDESRILIAVSKTSDPNLGWWFHAIDSKVIIGGLPRWADYPGIAVDDKAVYVTTNMFAFGSGGFSSGGVRLWIIDKSPIYNGPDQSAVVTVHDPYAAGGIAATSMPAHMWGPVPAGMGTWLVSHSGLTNGTNEFLQLVRVDDPLGTAGGPVFTQSFINVGDIDNVAFGLPDAQQAGTATRIEVNDRRALNAVWRGNSLYTCATIRPNLGPDTGQTTAHWWRLDTNPVSLADQGNIGAEDLGPNTYTFFPNIQIDAQKNVAVGFSASNSQIFCGAYYAARFALAPAGTIGPTCALQAGTDFYVRTFGGSRNRWGDYSGLALCPTDQATFWIYNEYACTRGTVISGEDGRWCTKIGSFQVQAPVAVAIQSFEASVTAGGVEIRSSFSSDVEVVGVNVYRSEPGRRDYPALLETVGGAGSSFRYLDEAVTPGRTYRYQIGVVDADGEFLSPAQDVEIPNADVALHQNTPNPFNPVTTITFSLDAARHVTLRVYDPSGRLVKTLADGNGTIGMNSASWDGTNNRGAQVSSGVYYYKLTAGNFEQTRRMVLLK